MREIGGYFELDKLVDKPFYEKSFNFNTGRSALLYLIKIKKIKKVFLPYFLCNSVSDHLVFNKVDFEFYHIKDSFEPIFNKELKSDEYLYIVNYYGQIEESTIVKYKKKFNNIILDNTQAFFQKPLISIPTIYSLRKFFGLPDGAYLFMDDREILTVTREKSANRMQHILGRFEESGNAYYTSFKNNDHSFKNQDIKKMSKISENLLGAIDYERVRNTRNKNFRFLKKELDSINLLNVKNNDGPFSYPLYLENVENLRENLSKKEIYIPTLWPNVLAENRVDTMEYLYAKNILPIPCDQRYNLEDMEYIVEEIKKCIAFEK